MINVHSIEHDTNTQKCAPDIKTFSPPCTLPGDQYSLTLQHVILLVWCKFGNNVVRKTFEPGYDVIAPWTGGIGYDGKKDLLA